MPVLRAATQQQTSIGVSTASSSLGATSDDMTVYPAGGLWEDDEEQKFYEDLPDLADFLPKQALGVQASGNPNEESKTETEAIKFEEQEMLEKLNQEIAELENGQDTMSQNSPRTRESGLEEGDEKLVFTRCIYFLTQSLYFIKGAFSPYQSGRRRH
jgi:regulator of nonsense transcripts 2